MFTQQYCKDNLFEIRQGDAYPINFVFYNDDGSLITPENINDISISIGKREKRKSLTTVTYNDGVWQYWLTQNDSYSFPVGIIPVSVIIKFNPNKQIGLDMDPMRILPTFNKVSL